MLTRAEYIGHCFCYAIQLLFGVLCFVMGGRHKKFTKSVYDILCTIKTIQMQLFSMLLTSSIDGSFKMSASYQYAKWPAFIVRYETSFFQHVTMNNLVVETVFHLLYQIR